MANSDQWVWLKKQEEQTAGFGPCVHFPGFNFGIPVFEATKSLFFEMPSTARGPFQPSQLATCNHRYRWVARGGRVMRNLRTLPSFMEDSCSQTNLEVFP